MGEDVFDATVHKLRVNSSEQDLMLRVFGYKRFLADKKDCIRKYESVYNPAGDQETFSNIRLDFLNDKNVYRLLCDYLYKCANTYFAQMRTPEGEGLWAKRDKLVNMYDRLAHGSASDMMQKVEDFLQENESVV